VSGFTSGEDELAPGRAPLTSDVIIVVIALIATAFAITLAVVVIEMWPWFRKRPDVAKESDDERRQA
jgi:hypothetical protein